MVVDIDHLRSNGPLGGSDEHGCTGYFGYPFEKLVA